MLFVRDIATDSHLTASPPDEYKRLVAHCTKVIEGMRHAFGYIRPPEDLRSATLSPEEISALSERDPEAFLRRYFFKNLLKCTIASYLYRSHLRSTRRIVDLGTGPGTFLFCFASVLRNHEFVGIDKNVRALAIARDLFASMRYQPPLLINAKLPQAIVSGGRFFTASYLLTELSQQDLFDFGVQVVYRPDAQFLVVDYPHTAEHFYNIVGGKRRKCIGLEVQMGLPPELAERIGDDFITFGTVYAPAITSPFGKVPRKLANPQYLRSH